MCGIALLFDYGVNSENTQKRQRIVENMMYAQIHRGRDSKVINHYSTCSVAFNRLAITEIDKSQPSEGDWKVYLNGEIYNYKELGYAGSEVEVISQGIKEHGMSFINKLNGIFVIIAINNREVYVIRDRYGCKPLYYWDNGKEIVIASEIKAILKHPGYKTSINYSAKRQWLVFNNVLTDETLFNGIKKLDKGTIWHLNTGRKIKYWSWKFNPIKMDIEDAKIEVFKLITKSVSRQIPSGIKAGIFASGGVDSNIIRVLASQLQSYTASFPGYEIDELDYARLVGPTKAIEFNSIKRFKETIYHLEDLRVGASWTNYCLYEEASKDGCKVILDGAGSDELFGGYSWRYSAENYYDVVNRTKISDQFCFDLFRNKFNDSLIERYLFDAEYFLEGVLLVGDKLGMAHTIEVRVPFLDNELVDFCLTIPNELKENKLILKQAFSELLPKEIIQGKKKGFSSPDWFDGPGNQARKWSENALNQWKQLYDITGAL